MYNVLFNKDFVFYDRFALYCFQKVSGNNQEFGNLFRTKINVEIKHTIALLK